MTLRRGFEVAGGAGEGVMSESMKSAGFGDGSEPDKFGAYRCRHTANITHPHLVGALFLYLGRERQ